MDFRQLEKTSPHEFWYDLRHQLQRFIYERSNEAFAAGDAARDAIRTPAELESRRAFLRDRFIENLGGLPPGDTPLNARTTGIVEHDGIKIEKIIFESRPGTFVTANLYLPPDVTSPRGAVLFLCGHHEAAKQGPEYQIVCQYLAHAGLVVLAQDPIGQGERFSYYEKELGGTTVTWGVTEHGYAGAQCLPLGDSLGRYFVHDSMRSVDYLMTRKEVDPNKIGVTGNSGGGTQTSLMMVCDPRIACAAPTTFIMNRQSYMYVGCGQDCEQIWTGMSALGFDHEDILLAMAPKPVRVLAVTSDFFPIEGTRRTVERCKRLWELYGKGDLVDIIEDNSTHTYTRNLAAAATEFFSRHLLGREVSPDGSGIQEIEGSRLWCTAFGQVRGEIAGARAVYEENVDRVAEIQKRNSGVPDAQRKEKGLGWLRERVFAGRKPFDLNPRFYDQSQVDDVKIEMCFWWAQEGLFNHGFAFRDFRLKGRDLPVTLAVWDGGTTCLQPHARWIRKTCAAGIAVVVLDVSGDGPLLPYRFNGGRDELDYYSSIFTLGDDLIWLNDSLAAMRTYDTLRALDMITAWPGLDAGEITGYAHGLHGLYLQLAAGMDKRIKDVEVVGGIGSYAEWVRSRHYDSFDVASYTLPGVLQYFDLPDLERWRKGTA
ncbi:MAG: prolyl oligopeptidase family serine peptidase [Armatimonadota bacterium]|nr:prolyl oligopeptidase family serine peptidase [Armatimonadota bacterium]